MAEESLHPEDGYHRLLMALVQHLWQYHEIDAFQFVAALHRAGILFEQDVQALSYHLELLIPRAGRG